MKFVDIFNEVGELAKQDCKTLAELLCKTTEELGELAQSLNKFIGIKSIKENETRELIDENILEEGADTIQCIMAILALRGFTSEDLKREISKKNKKYKDTINETRKILWVLHIKASKQV